MLTMIPEQELQIQSEQTLRRLRITGKLKGLWFLIHAITATVRDPRRTELITKDLYPEIAQAFHTTPSRVERSIRTAITVCWKEGRAELEEIAGGPLTKRPTNTEFIDLVATYIRFR